MTDAELIAYFKDRPLPVGHIAYSSFESTDDAATMVKLALERIEHKWPGSDTSREALIRLVKYLDAQ